MESCRHVNLTLFKPTTKTLSSEQTLDRSEAIVALNVDTRKIIRNISSIRQDLNNKYMICLTGKAGLW